MSQKSALLLGASGLTGGHLLNLLLESDAYHTVYIYSRRPIGIQNPKLKELIIDFDSYEAAVEADTVFCCLGTTIKKVKTQEAFKKVDLEYPVKFAKLQFEAGSKRFLVMSAMGAAADSLFFYSRVKAEMEKLLSNIGYPVLCIFRPALITGNRTEHRSGEKIAATINEILNYVLVGPLRKYQSVSALAIAKSMLSFAGNHSVFGKIIISSDRIKDFE
ncbi:MAG: NAD(P)H-binding protein [Chitinophagaceae bacterium]|nr:NAD(P)H-binding protein [Chitinophagaceae bacterium]